jgi:hypothetical protein
MSFEKPILTGDIKKSETDIKNEMELYEQNSNPITMQNCNYTRGLSSLHPGI